MINITQLVTYWFSLGQENQSRKFEQTGKIRGNHTLLGKSVNFVSPENCEACSYPNLVRRKQLSSETELSQIIAACSVDLKCKIVIVKRLFLVMVTKPAAFGVVYSLCAALG